MNYATAKEMLAAHKAHIRSVTRTPSGLVTQIVRYWDNIGGEARDYCQRFLLTWADASLYTNDSTPSNLSVTNPVAGRDAITGTFTGQDVTIEEMGALQRPGDFPPYRIVQALDIAADLTATGTGTSDRYEDRADRTVQGTRRTGQSAAASNVAVNPSTGVITTTRNERTKDGRYVTDVETDTPKDQTGAETQAQHDRTVAVATHSAAAAALAAAAQTDGKIVRNVSTPTPSGKVQTAAEVQTAVKIDPGWLTVPSARGSKYVYPVENATWAEIAGIAAGLDATTENDASVSPSPFHQRYNAVFHKRPIGGGGGRAPYTEYTIGPYDIIRWQFDRGTNERRKVTIEYTERGFRHETNIAAFIGDGGHEATDWSDVQVLDGGRFFVAKRYHLKSLGTWETDSGQPSY